MSTSCSGLSYLHLKRKVWTLIYVTNWKADHWKKTKTIEKIFVSHIYFCSGLALINSSGFDEDDEFEEEENPEETFAEDGAVDKEGDFEEFRCKVVIAFLYISKSYLT